VNNKKSEVGVNTGGSLLILVGQYLGANSTDIINITINDSPCQLTYYGSSHYIECISGPSVVGDVVTFPILVATLSSGGVVGTSPGVTFTYIPPPPTTLAINPSSGIFEGGTLVEILGTNLGTSATDLRITINSRACTSITWYSSTRIACITPSANGESIGPWPVLITTNSSQINVALNSSVFYTYFQPSAYITLINGGTFAKGTYQGGTVLDIVGRNLGTNQSDIEIKIGSLDCLVVNWISSTNLQCVTLPATVTNIIDFVPIPFTLSSSSFGFSNATFRYIPPPPIVTSITPSMGLYAGGTLLTVGGTNLGITISDLTVRINNVPCSVVSRADHSVFTCITGANHGGVGPWPVDVITLTSEQLLPDPVPTVFYTFFQPIPKIQSISPVRGFSASVTNLTIIGTDLGVSFTDIVSITIDNRLCPLLEWTSSSLIICEASPALNNNFGPFPINIITTSSGTNLPDPSPSVQFRYYKPPPVINAINGLLGASGTFVRGTTITVTGTWLGEGTGDVFMSMDGADCTNVLWRSP